MNEKLKLWDAYPSWEEAQNAWDEKAAELRLSHPLKTPRNLPSMPGITQETAHHLKWKSLKYLVTHDRNHVFRKHFFKHPFKYTLSLLKSCLKKKSYHRDEDFFLYGIENVQQFQTLLQNPDSLLIVGFSYCHKPHECPSGRFSTKCMHDLSHPVCRQCFIGKCVHALPNTAVVPLFITTIHYIGEKVFELVHLYPEKQILFLITACEMTLEMFGDWGNMVLLRGIGVRLDGRICNTMKAFELSEEGVKPGLTVVTEKTQRRILDLLKCRRKLYFS